jgi:hypothetical protein
MWQEAEEEGRVYLDQGWELEMEEQEQAQGQ